MGHYQDKLDLLKWMDIADKIAEKRMNEQNADIGNVVKTIAQAPNPIRHSTAGMDQALEPGPLGQTFSEKDIEDLAALKLNLHELENKLNDFETRGENSAKFEKQIKEVKQKIDDLSNAMTQHFPPGTIHDQRGD